MAILHGMSCFVGGSQRLVQELADTYGIGDGDTTADGELTVQVVNGCLGVCDRAPIAKIDDKYFSNLTNEPGLAQFTACYVRAQPEMGSLRTVDQRTCCNRALWADPGWGRH